MIRVAACVRLLHNERAEIVGATRMGHIMSLYLAVRRAHQSLESQLLLALPRGITSRQALILDLLLDRSAVDKQADIVAQIGIDRSTLADVMKRMQKHGLLERARDKRDARAYNVRLTPEGIEAANACRITLRRIEAKAVARLGVESAALDVLAVIAGTSDARALAA